MYAIETVDTEAKAQKLNDTRGDLDVMNVYIQVNTSREEQKGGLLDEISIVTLADYIAKHCPKLHLLGLMTIGSTTHSFESGENQDFRVC